MVLALNLADIVTNLHVMEMYEAYIIAEKSNAEETETKKYNKTFSQNTLYKSVVKIFQ